MDGVNCTQCDELKKRVKNKRCLGRREGNEVKTRGGPSEHHRYLVGSSLDKSVKRQITYC